MVGLLIAVILCAAMSSTVERARRARLDHDRRSLQAPAGREPSTPRSDLLASKLFTVLGALVAVSFASFASLLDNLIQAVNILGSIFYGTMLGLFVVGVLRPPRHARRRS